MKAGCLKNLLLPVLLLLSMLQVSAQSDSKTGDHPAGISMVEQLSYYSDISMLPRYFSNTIEAQTSTYDITGGNNDGFNGTHSFVRKDKDSNLVLFEVRGAGVVNRIWTPTPTEDTLDFYIDDSLHPAFSIKYLDLFSNKIFPFTQPLCGNELGGYYCYLPIPFQSYCRITCRARQTQFHQVQYRLYPPGVSVKKFSLNFSAEEKMALKKVINLWNREQPGAKDFFQKSNPVITSNAALTISPGDTKTIFSSDRGGRILGISFDNASIFEGLQKEVDIKITWDDEKLPAVYCPVADLFGYAFGKPSMQALLIGSRKNNNYCYLPMPFDKKATIELVYRKTGSKENLPLQVRATVSYTNEKRIPGQEGKFYTSWNSNQLAAGDPSHIFLQARGRGHYIGSMLLAQGMRPGMTYFFEGDDSTVVDGELRLHGTGSEDYFNGGWYAFPDRWSRKLSLPLHGALDYSLPFCRTGAYRFYLGDKISFEKNIYQGIEHGPEQNNFPVTYTSLAFYYCDTPPAAILAPVNESAIVYIPDTLVMYPQLMNFNVWENIGAKASWMYNTGGQSFIFSATDESRLKILLDEIPDGHYKLYADITNTQKGCSFSLWQGQAQLCDWIATGNSAKDERIPLQYLGEINLREFYKTLTIRFKTSSSANSLLLSRLIFVHDKKRSPGLFDRQKRAGRKRL